MFILFQHCTANNTQWSKAVLASAKSWGNHIRRWLGAQKVPTVVIQYEKLSTDLYTELKKMLDFLDVSYTKSDIQCAINSTSEAFHRKHSTNFDPYTVAQRKVILHEIQAVSEILLKYNVTYGN